VILQDNTSLGYISAFLGGIAVGFSPCVYPLIPITLSFIGVGGKSSRRKAFFLSLVYVSGIAVTYSALGLIAALTGNIFGRIAEHPASSLIVGNACIISGLSFLDVININFTGIRLQNKVKRTGGYLSAFLMGIVSGLIAGPCTAPALGVILVYVASKQNVFYGASLLLVFAYGMGLLLILSGTFSGMFMNTAKSEIWHSRIKKISGFFLIGVGEYFVIQAGRMMC
jgi:thiol:disulfide interchange protein DsbD